MKSRLVLHDVEQRRDKTEVLLLAAAPNMDADDDKLFRVFTPRPTCRRIAGSFAGNTEPHFLSHPGSCSLRLLRSALP
jgi:hypothetical protein